MDAGQMGEAKITYNIFVRKLVWKSLGTCNCRLKYNVKM
jgi:hypothetical protein